MGVMGVWLVSLHWGIAAILLAAVVPGVLVRATHAGRLYRWQLRNTPTERRAWYFDWMLTGITHAKEIRAFELGSLFRRRFSDLRAQLRRERLRLATRRLGGELLAQAGGSVAVFSAYAFVAYQALQGTMTLGDLIMYHQAFQRGQEFAGELLSGLAGLYEDHLFLSSLYAFLALPRKTTLPIRPRPVPRPMRRGIRFEGVSFRYPSGGRDVLQDVTLAIRPGEHVAIVGNNGSGKTTLIKLLNRLYDPASGAITLDGVDLREFDPAALRREMSVIFQDYARYYLSARDNIWFGNVQVAPQDPRIEAAARQSGADEVIVRLTKGYETILGQWLEAGEELSLGEWQKVALARAFLRDAQILVLDEPTSALDANAEYQLFTRFRQLAQNRTSILISHRFSTVRMADRIYVLEDGRILESGSHAELVRRGGKYAALFETQARSYR
jgi:ATP-binding cassette subfamily B protein